MLNIVEAITTKDYEIAAMLFGEYAEKLGVDLGFQDFNRELANIEQVYGRPAGVLFLAYENQQHSLGCFGIRKLGDNICELKRMYLREEARGLGYGKALLAFALQQGRDLGYQKMRLDTLPDMQQAIRLYEKMGFYDIPAYRHNPIAGTRFMEALLG
jgi:GNAT superfamily N-acetyltransferase